MQIAAVSQDINSVNTKANEYIQLSDNLKNIRTQVAENNKNKKAGLYMERDGGTGLYAYSLWRLHPRDYRYERK